MMAESPDQSAVEDVLAEHYANRYDERGGGVYGCRCGHAGGTVREHIAHVAEALAAAGCGPLVSAEATPPLMASEKATYQALRARGVSHEDALEDALDGVHVESVRLDWSAAQLDDAAELADVSAVIRKYLTETGMTHPSFHATAVTVWLEPLLARIKAEARAEGAQAALDDLERRIRHQAAAAVLGTMEWRAHFADLAHLEDARARAEQVRDE